MKPRQAATAIAAVLLLPASAAAANGPRTAPYQPGNIDLSVSIGVSGLVYPHVEPAIELAAIPIDEDFVIGLGGSVDLGWCLFCAVLDAISDDLDIESSYWTPMARISLHVGTFGGLIKLTTDFTLDPYVALQGGPSFYQFTITDENTGDTIGSPQTTVVAGPLIGVRLGFSDNALLIFGESRYMTEFGFRAVEGELGGIPYSADAGFARSGQDYVIGAGLRF